MDDTILHILIKQLHPFPDTPYKVVDNDELQTLIDSIKRYGIINPLIVRLRDEGGYEIISGHRRKAACEKAGIEKVPAYVREMDRDEAIITLVDSNLQREHVLPSEKAFAYKLKLEAIKRQGRRGDLTSRQLVGKLESAGIVGLETNESGRQVQRYIRLTKLIPPLLEMVDNGQMAFNPAVELSYLAKTEQQELGDVILSEAATPSLSQARRLKNMSASGKLTPQLIQTVITEEKANQKEQIKLPKDSIKGYFPPGYSMERMELVILQLLSEYQRKRERSRLDVR